MIEPLRDPAAHGGDPADAFHVVVASLPGYGFSGPTVERGWHPGRIAHAWAQLMAGLGYDRYVAQGGDWGYFVTREVAHRRPRALRRHPPQHGAPDPDDRGHHARGAGFPRRDERVRRGRLRLHEGAVDQAADGRVRARRLPRRARGVDRREVPHLVRLRRRRRAVVHQGPAARQPDGVLGHRDRALVGRPLLRGDAGVRHRWHRSSRRSRRSRSATRATRRRSCARRSAGSACSTRSRTSPRCRAAVTSPPSSAPTSTCPTSARASVRCEPDADRCRTRSIPISLAITADAPPRTLGPPRRLAHAARAGRRRTRVHRLAAARAHRGGADRPHDRVVRRRRDHGALVRPGARPRVRSRARPGGRVPARRRHDPGIGGGLRPARRRVRRRLGGAVPLGRVPGGAGASRTPPRSRTASPPSTGSCTTPTSCGSTPRASTIMGDSGAAGSPPASRCWHATAASRSPGRCSCTRCSTTARRCPIPSSHRSRRGRTTTTTPDGTRSSATRSATDAVPPSAAPARADDVSGLPPTYIDTGDLDIFRDEGIEYARRIAATGTTSSCTCTRAVPTGSTASPGSRSATRLRRPGPRARAL